MSEGRHLRLAASGPAANERQRTDLEVAREDLAEARAEAESWRGSWENVVDCIGDLIHKAKERPKGKRFATILELKILLTQAARSPPRDDGRAHMMSKKTTTAPPPSH